MGKYVFTKKYSIFNAFASGAERKHRVHISHVILNVMHSHVQLHSHTHTQCAKLKVDVYECIYMHFRHFKTCIEEKRGKEQVRIGYGTRM